MANYLRIDGEDEVYNMDFVRKMWKADEATEESENGLPVIYAELDNGQKMHIKFETAARRDAVFQELLGKATIIDVTTKDSEEIADPENFVEL
jgi:hypothetical protein